jgi:phage tail sheath protein FI
VLNHCERLGDRFAILDALSTPDAEDVLAQRSKLTSGYGALYHPWISVPGIRDSSAYVPPCGHIAGMYARGDQQVGVHKAPANEVVEGVLDVLVDPALGEQERLYAQGVNVVQAFPGRGIRVWGARTLSIDPMWKYVNVRRLFLFLEESIEEGTQWVVFEPNSEPLWDRVRRSIESFLLTVWRNGALMGTRPDQAFYVKCDRNTMTQDDIDNGRLICYIGVAPVKPAEFVVFRMHQWALGAKTAV